MSGVADPGHHPLKGVTVLELSQMLAGPACGLMLADLGASVYKIERFPQGDDARNWRRPGDDGVPASFVMLNRGKRSIALDVRTAEGKAVLIRLARRADVLTENFRVGVMERLGIGWETLREHNPALIFCSISGYGRAGPLAGKGGFDLILQAFSGLISVTGEEGRDPVKPGVSISDVNAGILGALGVLAAYVHRLRTGRGQRVDTSLLQASLQQLYWYAAAYFSKGTVPRPVGTAHPVYAPYEVFRCADGGLAIGGANQTNWERLAVLLGHPEWIHDPRFDTNDRRMANRAVLAGLIDAVLSRGTVAEWAARLDAAGIPAGPVQDVAQALEHEQARAVGMVVEARAPDGGTTRALGLPVLFDGRNEIASGAAPRLGEHTVDGLRSLGLAPEEIEALLDRGIAYQAG